MRQAVKRIDDEAAKCSVSRTNVTVRLLSSAPGPVCSRAMRPSPPAVLVIDDEVGVSQIFALLLKRAGYTVFVAANGEAGIGLALQELPRLIFCDERMPVLDGYGTLKKLKENAQTAKIPVIMMGGTSEEGMRDWAREGAAGFLSKPFQVKQMITLVQEWTKEQTPAA